MHGEVEWDWAAFEGRGGRRVRREVKGEGGRGRAERGEGRSLATLLSSSSIIARVDMAAMMQSCCRGSGGARGLGDLVKVLLGLMCTFGARCIAWRR